MDSDRKYRQHGYFDSNSNSSNGNGNGRRSKRRRPKPSGPRPPLDITGPRLPRLVQAVTASRCYNCSTTLLPDTALSTAQCPKCGTATALLQAVLPLRAFDPLSVHEADTRSHPVEGPGERMYAVFAAGHRGARSVLDTDARQRPPTRPRSEYAASAQCERRARRFRPSVQEIDRKLPEPGRFPY